jgi:hypothetical protein
MRQWRWKVWGAILGGLIVVVAGWLGVITAAIVIAGAVIGFLIGAVIDGNLGFRVRRGR